MIIAAYFTRLEDMGTAIVQFRSATINPTINPTIHATINATA